MADIENSILLTKTENNIYVKYVQVNIYVYLQQD